MTNINFDVPMTVLSAEPWRARLGAFSPRSAFPGTSVPGVDGIGPSGLVVPVPRIRDKAALAVVPAPQTAPAAAQLGQTNNYNHMTSVFAGGEGASGPPPDREPA